MSRRKRGVCLVTCLDCGYAHEWWARLRKGVYWLLDEPFCWKCESYDVRVDDVVKGAPQT